MLVAEKSAVVATVNAAGKRSRSRIREGKLYRSDDPVVQGREHLFREVEEATAAPGEKRSLSRPRRGTRTASAQAPAAPTPKASEPKASSAQPQDADGE